LTTDRIAAGGVPSKLSLPLGGSWPQPKAIFDLTESIFRFVSESGFGFTGKKNGLDSWAWSSVTSLWFVYVGDVGVTSFYC